MHDLAIHLENVSKVYKLFGSQKDQLIDVLGLQRFGFKTNTVPQKFSALSDISLSIPKGHRVGIIGRNGAGKSTLLKLLCGNFAPSSGTIAVNGEVQALMSVGLGFHPEYTGRENVEASLLYNGLTDHEYDAALDGIIDFCELGEFLDQPFKTYSMGMQARLMFASATAIKPDILIVDEVLGAGDAYFVAKSKQRVQKLIDSGCSMLLVSHSMTQILELCNEVLWLDHGQVRMQGEAFEVVKAYEHFIHGPIQRLETLEVDVNDESDTNIIDGTDDEIDTDAMQFQDPKFMPHKNKIEFPSIEEENLTKFHCESKGGVSRWGSKTGLKIVGFVMINNNQITDTLISLSPAKLLITVQAEITSKFDCRYGIAIDTLKGDNVTKIFSPRDQFKIKKGDVRTIELVFNPFQIGPGEYTIGITVLDYESIEKLNSAARYDLLSRSFDLKVSLPDSLSNISSSFFHSAEWKFVKQEK